MLLWLMNMGFAGGGAVTTEPTPTPIKKHGGGGIRRGLKDIGGIVRVQDDDQVILLVAQAFVRIMN